MSVARRAVLWSLGPLLSWVAIGNAFLQTDLADRAINRKPEKLRVEWRAAWTVVPGIVHVRDLRLRGQNREIQWSATVDRAVLGIRFWELPLKRFVVSGGRGEGVELRFRRRWDRLGEAPVEPAAWPPIDGLANPPPVPPEELYPAHPDRRWRWRVRLAGVSLAGVRELWVDQLRLQGEATVRGGFDFRLHESMRSDGIDLSWTGGRLSVGETVLADELEAQWEVVVAPFEPRTVGWRELLGRLSGRYVLRAELESLGFLAPYLGDLRRLTLDGEGRLEADLRVDRGTLEQPSRLLVDARSLRVGLLEYVATGTGRVVAAVGGTEPPVSLRIYLDGFALGRRGLAEPYAEGGEMELHVKASELSLDRGLQGAEATAEIPSARVEDLSVYEAFLLESLGIALGGSGTLSGELHLPGPGDEAAHGHLDLASDDLVVASGERRVGGHLRLVTRLREVAEDRYDLAGTALSLDAVRAEGEAAAARTEPGWSGSLELVEGTMTVRPGFGLAGRAHAELADSGPLITLLAAQKAVVDWFEGALTVRDVTAESAFEAGPGRFVLRDLAVRGEDLEILGDFSVQPAPKEGLLFLRLGSLSAGLEIRGEERDWKLTDSRDWFEARRQARDQS